MPITQRAKNKVRAGLQQNLPLLDKGELGWCVDSQKLYIGNGTVADGAPFAGNTEILTLPNVATTLPSFVPYQGLFLQSPNGTLTTFTMPVTPYPNTLIVWVNIPVAPNISYTWSGGNTVTFAVPPVSTDDLFFMCWIVG